jgi:tetratricopeptide (TPR) repeat protein
LKTIEKMETPAPLSLTMSDGSGLNFKSYESNTFLDGIFAFTEIKLKFYNPEDRIREGRFRIQLPQGAEIARFAMKIGDKFQEGEVVDKEKATLVYEDFLHRKQDPALLEKDASNEFAARVFPIPANAEKELLISYSMTIDSNLNRFEIPLKGLPEIENLKINVMYDFEEFSSDNEKEKSNSKKTIFSFKKENYTPKENFIFETKLKKDVLVCDEKYFAVKINPFPNLQVEKSILINPIFLLDTSASAAVNFKKNIGKIKEIAIDLNLSEFDVYSFDNDLSFVGRDLKAFTDIESITPLGGSNLYGAIQKLLQKESNKNRNLILFSDAVATIGKTDKKDFSKLLSKRFFSRIDIITPSSYTDPEVIKVLKSSSKNIGSEIQLTATVKEISNRLRTKFFKIEKISVPNSKWIYPDKIESIAGGESIVIFGLMDTNSVFNEINILGQKFSDFRSVKVDPILLEREILSRRIKRLEQLDVEELDEDKQKAYQNQIKEISLKHRISSKYTSFLVLETDEDYKTYNIERNTLSDLVTVTLNGLEKIERKNSETTFIPERQIPKLPIRINQSKVDDIQDGSSFPAPVEKQDWGPMNKSMDMKKESSSVGTDKDGFLFSRSDVNRRPKENKFVNTFPTKTLIAEEPSNELILERRKLISQRLKQMPLLPKETKPLRKASTYNAEMKSFQELMDKAEFKKAKIFVQEWRQKSPTDLLGLIALGEISEKLGDRETAIRAYTSLIDFFPNRADMRRWAAERLLSLNETSIAIDSLEKALALRPDHPTTYLLLANSYIQVEKYDQSLIILTKAFNINFPERYTAIKEIILDTIELVSTLQKTKDREFLKIKNKHKLVELTKAELRIFLFWETDTNDVDFHIFDKWNNHVDYQNKIMKSGGELYADITSGYGPEFFRVIEPKEFPYSMEANYYSKGPMGFGMGAIQIMKFSKEGTLKIETRNFLVMEEGAFISLGKVLND